MVLMPTPYVGLLVDGTWEEVSSYVRYDIGITVTRGRRSETGGMEAQTAELTFNNPDKRFTPDHPTSPWYGLLGRNTPIRIARDTPNLDTYLYLEGGTSSPASTPDSAGLSVTGDLEIQIDLALDEWDFPQDLCSKYTTTGNQRSWALNLESDSTLRFFWSSAGSSFIEAISTTPVVADPRERVAIKVTLDVDNGAAGNDVKFWTRSSSLDPWVQLGATVTGSGTTSVFDSTTPVVVGDIPTSAFSPMSGRVYGFKLLNGIGGSEVANPDFTAQDDQTTSFTDAAGNTWTLAGTAAFIVEGPWRFHGEIPEWPVVSDITGNLVTVSIEAAGIWRRLTQNEEPLNSTMYRSHIRNADDLKQYWPLEDGTEATSAASALSGHPSMRITGTPQMGSYDGWTASDAMVQLDTGRFVGRVPGYASTGDIFVYFFIFVDANPAAETDLIIFTGSGTVRKWKVLLLANSNLRVRAYDEDDNELTDGAGNLGDELSFGMASLGFTILAMHIEQNGSDVDWTLWVYDFTNTDTILDSFAGSGFTGTLTNQTVGTVQTVILNDNSNIGDSKGSHLVVSADDSILDTVTLSAICAYNGEFPFDRVSRLCGEEDIPLIIVSSENARDTTVTMGDQRARELTELLKEAEETELGILYETRERFGLGYRTRLSLANQAAAATLSHSSNELAQPLRPVKDDQRLKNDITITRDQGSFLRVTKETGPMSILPPMQGGVGRYPDAKTLSITFDSQLADQAGFRLRLGTEPGARYPQLVVNLHHPSISGDAALLAALVGLDMGDRIVVTDLPERLPPDDISVLVHGYSERFDQLTHTISYVCVPEAPWQWAIADDTAKRAGATASETVGDGHAVTFVGDAETLNSSSTSSVTVNVPAGTADGHVMVALIGLIGQETITPPAGWDPVGVPQDAGSNVRYAAYTRVASSEPANYTWSWTSNFKNSGWIGAYSGADTTTPVTPVTGYASNGTGTSGTEFTTGTATAADVGGRLVTGVFERHAFTGAATTWTNPSAGDTERYDNGSNAGSGQDISHAVYDSAHLDPGAYTRTLTASQAVSQIATWAVVLNPDTTTLTVATTQGPVWVDTVNHPDDFPFNIRVSGVVYEVTGITGTTSPQTFTVTSPAENGIEKVIAGGSPVELATKAYVGMI